MSSDHPQEIRARQAMQLAEHYLRREIDAIRVVDRDNDRVITGAELHQSQMTERRTGSRDHNNILTASLRSQCSPGRLVTPHQVTPEQQANRRPTYLASREFDNQDRYLSRLLTDMRAGEERAIQLFGSIVHQRATSDGMAAAEAREISRRAEVLMSSPEIRSELASLPILAIDVQTDSSCSILDDNYRATPHRLPLNGPDTHSRRYRM
jgi:hypothetical protein